MDQASTLATVFQPLSFGLGLLLGAVLVGVYLLRRIIRLEKENGIFAARLESEKEGLGDHFKSLAQQVFQSNNENFLTLAQTRLNAAHEKGAMDLDKRTMEIQKMVQPVEKNLVLLNGALEQMNGGQKALQEHLQNLHRETAKLTGVLRDPKAQGRWGEFILEGLLTKANLIKGVHYDTQKQIADGRRPDVIINLHEGFKIAIDSKAPINQFIERMEEAMTEVQVADLQRGLADTVRRHIRELGAKSYQDQVKGSDFVILFLPSESVFSAALRADPDLADFASENKVVIASPTLIISLLRVVGLSWRQVEMAKNAVEISTQGVELHKRLTKFLDHFSKIGKSVDSALKSYNEAVGSLERSVMPAARKFEKHIGRPVTTLPDMEPFENSARLLLGMAQKAEEQEIVDFEVSVDDKANHG